MIPIAAALFELFERGGPVMWAILLCSIVGLAIVLERIFTLSHIEGETSRLRESLERLFQANRLAEAKRLCETSSSPLGRIVQAGLRRIGRPGQEIRQAMERQGARELPALERYVPMLGTIAHIAPLLGLLGTVMGLVRCFQVIQEKATTIHPVHPGDLAGGIWEALLTTVFGLLVAIPLYTLYNLFVHRIHSMTHEWEVSSSDLVDLVMGREEPSFEPTHLEQTHAIS